MGPVLSMSRLRAGLAIVVVGLSAVVLSACSTRAGGGNPNVVAGKQLFVSKCGSCHTLARADTKGNVGPNLDEAFQQPLKNGFGRSGIEGLVHGWILHPNSAGVMPAGIVTGQQAHDVASYVAKVVAKGGKDTGLLATAVKKAGGGQPAVAKNGTVQIDADPTGQLAFVTNLATAPPGKLTVKMANKSSTPHDIVIDGKGAGKQVTNGGISSFTASFTAGTYTYYCSVPGHRAAGMEGKLTVK
ncbi:MAG: plastocyanin/azurin family copper-binding protein [Solirubrobacteraceae bacterium]